MTTLNTEEIQRQLDSRAGTFDLGFCFGEYEDSGLPTQAVGEAELFAVFPAHWDLPADAALTLDDLADFPYIASFDATPVGQICSNLFAVASVEPQVVARIHTHHLAGRLVQRDIGYTLLDSVTARALLHDKNADAVALRRIDGAPSIAVTAMFRAQRSVSNQASLFVRCFQDAYAALNGTVEERLP